MLHGHNEPESLVKSLEKTPWLPTTGHTELANSVAFIHETLGLSSVLNSRVQAPDHVAQTDIRHSSHQQPPVSKSQTRQPHASYKNGSQHRTGSVKPQGGMTFACGNSPGDECDLVGATVLARSSWVSLRPYRQGDFKQVLRGGYPPSIPQRFPLSGWINC